MEYHVQAHILRYVSHHYRSGMIFDDQKYVPSDLSQNQDSLESR